MSQGISRSLDILKKIKNLWKIPSPIFSTLLPTISINGSIDHNVTPPHLQSKSKRTSTSSIPSLPKFITGLQLNVDETSEVNKLQIISEVFQIIPKINSAKDHQNEFESKYHHGDILNVHMAKVPTSNLQHTKATLPINSLLQDHTENQQLIKTLDDSGTQAQRSWRMYQNKLKHKVKQKNPEGSTIPKFINEGPLITSPTTLSHLHDSTEETNLYNLRNKSSKSNGYELDRTPKPITSREPNATEYNQHPWSFGNQK